jgi:Protein of unknown function (DUF2501)
MQPSKRVTRFVCKRVCAMAAFAAVAMAQLAPPVRAQLSGVLGSGQGGAGNALGGLSGGLPSVTQAGPANTAGVLQYCIQNNYLNGGIAGSAKDALLGKVPSASQSSDFQSGSSGLLQTGNGQSFNLGDTGSIKSQLTQKLCDMVLQHAKSLL